MDGKKAAWKGKEREWNVSLGSNKTYFSVASFTVANSSPKFVCGNSISCSLFLTLTKWFYVSKNHLSLKILHLMSSYIHTQRMAYFQCVCMRIYWTVKKDARDMSINNFALWPTCIRKGHDLLPLQFFMWDWERNKRKGNFNYTVVYSIATSQYYSCSDSVFWVFFYLRVSG